MIRGLSEKDYQNRYIEEVQGGELEVKCSTGIIDILTFNKIIEVKEFRAWKSAIGQILMYGNSYPNKQKTIVLFKKGNYSLNKLKVDLVVEHCLEQGIEVDIRYLIEDGYSDNMTEDEEEEWMLSMPYSRHEWDEQELEEIEEDIKAYKAILSK